MSPRPRSRKRRGWPDNLQGHYKKKNGKTYYAYRNPHTGAETPLGTDFAAAKQAAIIANNALMRLTDVDHMVDRILGEPAAEIPFSEFLETFKSEILPAHRNKKGRPYAEKTLREYQRRVGIIQQQPWAAKPLTAENEWERVNLRDVAGFLDDQAGARTSNVYRQILIMAFKHAIAKGLCKENLAAATLEKTAVKQRQRLTLEWFQRIHEVSPEWFQIALDLAIQTLQRRDDLATMRFTDEREPGWLFVDQKKVEGHGTGHIRIEIGPELRAVLSRAKKTGILSPFIIHRRPEKRQRRVMDAKDHWTQVSPAMLTRKFKEIRDQLHLCDHLSMGQRPSFHEIRALGADLYRRAGWPEDAIQRLLGHASGKTTRVYLEGHEVQYVQARAGLKIA